MEEASGLVSLETDLEAPCCDEEESKSRALSTRSDVETPSNELEKVYNAVRADTPVTTDSEKVVSNTTSTSSQSLPTCRICCSDESQTSLMQPCDCSGSMSYVHRRCLLKWILVRPSISSGCQGGSRGRPGGDGDDDDMSPDEVERMGLRVPSAQELKETCEVCHVQYRIERVYRLSLRRRRCLKRSSVLAAADASLFAATPVLVIVAWSFLLPLASREHADIIPSRRASMFGWFGSPTQDIVVLGLLALLLSVLAVPTAGVLAQRWCRCNSVLDIAPLKRIANNDRREGGGGPSTASLGSSRATDISSIHRSNVERQKLYRLLLQRDTVRAGGEVPPSASTSTSTSGSTPSSTSASPSQSLAPF